MLFVRRHSRTRLAGAVAIAITGLGMAGYAVAGGSDPIHELKDSGIGVLEMNGRIARVYGPDLAFGTSARDSAESFIRAHADALGVSMTDLEHRKVTDGFKWFDDQPIMYQQDTGRPKFLAVYYDQYHEGIPVDGAQLMVLARNEPSLGYPIVLVSSSLVDLSEFEFGVNQRAPKQAVNGYEIVAGPQAVVYVDRDRRPARGHEAAAAYEMVVQRGRAGEPVTVGFDGTPQRHGTYEIQRVILDASSGEVLFSESLIRAIDVYGNVSGWATPGLFPDWDSNPEELFPLPAVTAQIVGGHSGNTDVNGDYVIPHGGSSQVTVRSRMVGPSLSAGVNDQMGAELQIDLNITPPGPADFEHNVGKTQYDTAEVNAMLQTALIHSWVLDTEPSFPGTGRSFYANVNINSSCNAYYDGSSINFYIQSGGCPNTAYSTVVYHEYGHKLIDDAASGPSGDYHEGMADAVAAILPDTSRLAEDFFGPGTGPLRDADNNLQYPCGGESHYCGQVVSGCVWHTRDALTVTEPDNYLAIIQSLTLASIPIHVGGVDPGMTIDFLTLDDNDGDLRNGSPHYHEINEGFSRHNMPAPDLDFLYFTYPDGLPATVDSRGGTTFRVEVHAAGFDPEPGTGALYYDDGSGWQSVPMNEISPNVYDAVFPAVTCPSQVVYYVAAKTVNGDQWTDPKGAPNDGRYSAPAAETFDFVLADNFETNTGWTVQYQDLQTGVWQRGVPVGQSNGAPDNDFDGSGKCFVTDNDRYEDVDGGPTRLLSPTFSLDGGDGLIEYAYWMYSSGGTPDNLIVSISNDGGNTWTYVTQYGNNPDKTWMEDGFHAGEYITPTGEMRVRFSVSDNPADSQTEAAIDAFRVNGLYCNLLELNVPPLNGGRQATLTSGNVSAGETVYFVYSRTGRGGRFVSQLDVTLDLDSPRLAGSSVADGAGVATLNVDVPSAGSGHPVWFQTAVIGRKSNVVERTIN